MPKKMSKKVSYKKRKSYKKAVVPAVVKTYVKREIDRNIEDKYMYTPFDEFLYSNQGVGNPPSYIPQNIFQAWPISPGVGNSQRIGDKVKFKYLSFHGEIRNLQAEAVTVKACWIQFNANVEPLVNAGRTNIITTGFSDMFVAPEVYCDQWSIANGGAPIAKFKILKTEYWHLAGVTKELDNATTNTVTSCFAYGSTRHIKISCKPPLITHYVNDKDEPVRNSIVLVFNISNDVSSAEASTLGVTCEGMIYGTYQDA